MKMVKIINPCKCDVGNKYLRNAYAKITYENGNLSIRGSVKPFFGQCVDEIRGGVPTESWTPEMLRKFCNIWDEWHLNDMRPYCEHMKELGWDKQARETVKITKWHKTKEAMQKEREVKYRLRRCLENGETFIPTEEEALHINLKYIETTYNDELLEHPEFYEFTEKNPIGVSNVTYEIRSWLKHDKCELGFIGKPCPVCGYEYGTQWIKEEVPREVIDFLFNLPETKIAPPRI